ncbi:hypothetical protein HOLleu_36977 [Holothuria leucospilota]|uniref:Uncharacterized protein n=1 Tax=Holothuria leucospilota TaxID=206669 RepID=A0A9Q0YMQ9_HOLLE|nr:hypothetical protein HOLleu_36977 [Holothuria leucospilota]
MTHELSKPFGEGSFIPRFVAGGQKNHAYKVCSTKRGDKMTLCKIRVITLTPDLQGVINYETIARIRTSNLSERQYNADFTLEDKTKSSDRKEDEHLSSKVAFAVSESTLEGVARYIL